MSLLTTKLKIPPARPQLVVRSRLIERLQEGLNYNLILISAPAGFGKTTLLTEWARCSNPQIITAWYSLDEGDNDPVRFWDYFIMALKTLQPDIGENILPSIHSSQPPSTDTILTALINDISVIAGDFIAVLDDYHLIESKQIHDGITYLLEHMPVQMHLVIATRADPPLPLARFRGYGAMLEIRTDDLRFTDDDATNLLKELKTPQLSTNDIVSLNERTEGWAVGLKMAALSMRGQKDIPEFIAAFTGSQRYVMDYLVEEVLQKQTHDVRDFLMKTSILKRLNGPLCNAVTGRSNNQDMLLKLDHDNMFIVPLDESRQWYRYEHLFADLLHHQCESTYGTEQVFDLHQLASQWYEQHQFPDDAIHHALAARDWEGAMRLIYTQCEERRKRGEFNTLLGWFQAIPDELLRENHQLYCQYASFLSAIGQLDVAEAALNYLESTVKDDAVLRSDVAFLLSNIAWLQFDIERVKVLAERSLSLLPPHNILMRSRTIFSLGFVQYVKCLFNDAEKLMTESYEVSMQAGDIWIASAALTLLGTIKNQRGELDDASELFKRAIKVAGETQGVGWGASELSKVLYERNDLEMAAQNARLATEWYELGGNAEPAIAGYFVQAQIWLISGNEAELAEAMGKIDRANRYPGITPQYHAYHAAYHTILAIRQHNLEAADKWGRQLSEYSDVLFIEYQSVPARLLIAQGKKEPASKLLGDLFERLVKVGAHGLTIGVRVCQALAADTEESALAFLSDALIKGEYKGCVRTFVDEGKLLKPLLENALSRGITPVYTRKLLSTIEAEEKQNLKMKRGGVAPSSTQSVISERELEVLCLMAEGLSNQQIAVRLFISLSTTKNHVHNILEKLGVQGRTQAIAQARELKLL
jgi:LuxR family transcriptional regulator, maltose regulon positive regulatory protein